MTNRRNLILKGVGFGLTTGLIFGLFEILFSLAVVEDLLQWGTGRSYVTHDGLALSMLAFDAGFGLFWGLAGVLTLLWLSRREGPLVKTDAFLCFWMALAVTLLYPTWFLFAKFLGPESRFAPFWLPVTVVWLGVAACLGAALFYLFAVRFRAAGSYSLNLLASIVLSALVAGGAYWNSGARSITDPVSLLTNLVLVAMGIATLLVVLQVSKQSNTRRGVAVVMVLLLAAGAVQQALAMQVRVTESHRGEAQATPSPHEAGQLPNVLLIVMDTQRKDRLSMYAPDLDTSPNLAQLAEDSVVYENCIATSSWTLPSHASLFTGLYPAVHGADYRLDAGISPLNPDRAAQSQTSFPLVGRPTLAEILRDGGYRTGAVCGNCGYLHPVFGLNRGFQFYDARMPQPFRNPPAADLALYPLRRALPFDYVEAGYRVEPQLKTYRSARSVGEVSREWMAAGAGEPFFLFVNFCDPHAPYIPPFNYDLYSDPNTTLRSPRAADVAYNTQPVSAEMREHLLALYDGEVRYMDAQIGALIGDLQHRGIYDETLVIVTSDHGEYFGEHGRLGHGGHLHEVVINVPLLVKYPKSRETGRSLDRVSLVDLMPTILEETGQEPPDFLEGKSLRHGSRPVIAELYPSADRVAVYGEEARRTLRVLYEDHWKLLQVTGIYGPPEYSLYNVREDPGETADLSETNPVVTERLRVQLEEWLEDAQEKRFEDTELPEMDEGLRETMESLGYVKAVERPVEAPAVARLENDPSDT